MIKFLLYFLLNFYYQNIEDNILNIKFKNN